VEFPEDLLYTEEDEWLRVEDAEATVGITDYAQDQLGDVVYVELAEVGRTLAAGDTFGTVESVKAVSDLYFPVAGIVLAVNEALVDAPELVNRSPYGDGWLVRVRLAEPGLPDGLLSAADYSRPRASGG
jgi:glycine cleavage system H protein